MRLLKKLGCGAPLRGGLVNWQEENLSAMNTERKNIASELCDKERLSDAFLVVEESYQKLRDFSKAIKWYTKSWEGYKSIGNLEVSLELVL